MEKIILYTNISTEETQVILYTYNLKDFRYIENISLHTDNKGV